jgi:dienelactone hydrolase
MPGEEGGSMYQWRGVLTAAFCAVVLAACGSSSTTSSVSSSTARGTLVQDPPPRLASVNAADLQAQLSANTTGMQLLQLAGNPTCGVDVYYMTYWTIDATGNPTESTGALMVPTGAAPTCSGPRPIVLYAHATQFLKSFNIADITNADDSEGLVVAALFAAQGYTVVASNYAGYDASTLGYHPFLDAKQQTSEMMDVLAAARTALPHTFASATSDSGVLFVTGYSEGGHVAMATVKALESNGQSVAGAAPMSGPYAMEALLDAVMFGDVNIGSTAFTPLITTSWQEEYGNLYSATSDLYSSTYAGGINTLLPSDTPLDTLFSEGKLPETALFDITTPVVTVPGNAPLSAALTAALTPPTTPPTLAPIFDLGFGNPYLFNNSVRVSWALDAASDPDGEDTPLTMAAASPRLAPAPPMYPLRLAAYDNDMRYWWGTTVPAAPMLMCGGENDPTVFFSVDTGTMVAFWSGVPTVSSLDVDPATGPSGPFAAIQGAFQASEAAQLVYLQTAAGGGLTLAQATEQLVENYHTDVFPFCALAARSFFAQL